MENYSDAIESLVEKAQAYGKSQIELVELKAIDKSAEIVSSLATKIFLAVIFSLAFLILNIGLALWIGDLLGKSQFGFFIVAGFYFLIGLLFYAFRNKWIKTPMRNSIILKALK